MTITRFNYAIPLTGISQRIYYEIERIMTLYTTEDYAEFTPLYVSPVCITKHRKGVIKMNPIIKHLKRKLLKAKLDYSQRLVYREGRNYIIINNK